MSLCNKKYEKYLALYGPRQSHWPEELRGHWAEIQQSPTCMAQLIEAQYIEEVLLTRPQAEAPSPDLAERIIRTARIMQSAPKASFIGNLRAALEYLVPHPAAAFASVLLLGLVAGMSVSSLNPTENTTNVMDMDTGGIL